ncbi:hypothetical protein [Streptomyces sp. NBC_01373]|uniref:hypothetical protein n=1 Tax=Streptomyces sp. NBC_01373 TaxID=2903843 RepID=UPI00224E84ED|nr:hypothetical protein [Streptomyces sp. NBC_01373]MCX4699532.1 hypothetical protein [Streptomyces sp. NBC_01373]
MAVWQMSHRLDDAREAFVESGVPVGVDSVSVVVRALVASLATAGPVRLRQAPAGPVAGQGGPLEPGWSARSRRQS